MPDEIPTAALIETPEHMMQQTSSVLQDKIQQVVEDFAAGRINQTQFHTLYTRYQRQMHALGEWLAQPAAPRESETTFALKKRLTARVSGLSIYNNLSGLPIETLGHFAVDPLLLMPMLSSYRSMTAEVFRAGIRSTAMENDQWLCFVPGNLTTMVALFSCEPSTEQLKTAERMHRDFETANAPSLSRGQVDARLLAYPFLWFIQRAFGTKSK